jgi:hypothetical protein
LADQNTRIEVADVLAVDAEVARSTGAADFGITRDGFVPKQFARLLAEKLALARALFGNDVDLGSGSAIRKVLEVTALEHARTWSALSTMYDDSFVGSARGDALSRLGEELGFPRPHLEARGKVKVSLVGTLAAGQELDIPRGARMLTPGGHHVATDESVTLSPTQKEREVAVAAFYPGPDGNLNPGTPSQKIDRWNTVDTALQDLVAASQAASPVTVKIDHTAPLQGGELYWPDARYRELLLRVPRSIWTADAIELAVSLVPGVRQVQVKDPWGGLDINQSIFGDFNFIQRVFGSERELGSPYYLTVLVAPTPAAIWTGADGLRAQIESAIEDIRPAGILPNVEEAEEVGVGLMGDLIVRGLPIPSGSPSQVNSKPAAVALKNRLLQRLRRYVDGLEFGEPVRIAEMTWAVMNEPGVEDVREPRLLRFPPRFDVVAFEQTVQPDPAIEQLDCGANLELQANQIPRFVDDPVRLRIV